MHVLQWIAVEADEPEEDVIDLDECKHDALVSVDTFLEDNVEREWYDWYVVGGGRWNIEEGEDDLMAGYKAKTNMIIHAGTDIDRFKETIEKSLESRMREFSDLAKDVKPDIIYNIISNYDPKQNDYSLFSQMYPIKKVIDMALGEWDFNSYFFDNENQTTNPKYVLEAIDKEPNSWYLVPVDFHF